MLQLALNTGMRKGEQLKMEWSHVNFGLGQITIPAENLKSGKSRIIPMNEVVVATLQKTVRRIDSPFVYPGRNPSKPREDFSIFWEEYLKQAGIEDFHWHDLRHTFASRLVMARANLLTVSKLLGHADLKMTMRYAHLAPDYLQRATDTPVRIESQTGTATARTAEEKF
jgi:integrase